jgi:hypothetical protein
MGIELVFQSIFEAEAEAEAEADEIVFSAHPILVAGGGISGFISRISG